MEHSVDGYQRQRAVRLLAVMAALVITHGAARAQTTPSATISAGQTGRIAFETITLNDSQFLSCFSRGTTAGYSRAAHAEALQAVKTFLSATFKLRP